MTRPDAPTPGRRRRVRRVLVAAAVMAGLLLVLAGVAEVLRRSDVPRRLAVQALRDATGLDVRLSSLEVGWFGGSTARGVELFLPLERAPFFTAPEVHASHASLARVALTQQLSLSSIQIDRPHLSIARDDLGRWNAARAFDSIVAAARARARGDGRLPALAIRDGVMEFARAGASPVTSAFQFDARAAGRGWDVEARAEGLGTIEGQFDPGAAREHLVRFELAPDRQILRALGADPPNRLLANGTWRGFVRAGEVSGLLTLDRTAAGVVEAAGALRLAWGPAGVRLEPVDLEVSVPARARASGGALAWNGADWTMEGISLTLPGAVARVGGSWRASQGTGGLDVSWTGEAVGPILEHDGAATVTLRADTGRNLIVEGNVRSAGRTAGGRWSAEARVNALAAMFDHVESRLEFPALTWTDKRGTIDLAHLAATISADPDRVRLLALDIPETTRSAASGVLDLAKERFAIELDVAGWRPAAPSHGGPLGPIDLALTASGDSGRINIERASLGVRGASATAKGWMEPGGPFSLSAEALGSLPFEGAPGPPEPGLAGDFRASLEAKGTMFPVAIAWTGQLEAGAASFAGRPLGNAVIPARGELRAEQLTWTTDAFDLLGGTALVGGSLAGGIASVTLDLESVEADRIAQLTGSPRSVSGRIGATASLTIPIDCPADATGVGHWSAERIAYDGFRAERASGAIEADGGHIRLTRFEAFERDGRITGTAEFAHRERDPIEFRLHGERWPLAIGDATGRLDGAFLGTVDPRTFAICGQGDLVATADLAGRTARLESRVSLDGANVTVDPIRATVGGGVVTGRAVVPLGDWMAAQSDLEWSGIDLGTLAQANGLTGTVSGRASIGPDPSPRALGPVRLTASMAAQGGAYHGVQWTHFVLDLSHGQDRTTIDRLELATAGGTIIATGSTAMHGQERFASGRAVLNGIDLASIAAATDREPGTIRGRLRGEVFAAGYANEPHRLFGQAELAVSEAEFASLPGLSAIYDELRIGKRDGPAGEGRASVRMEGHSLEISRFHYLDRGVDLVGQVRMHDIRAGASSEVSGLVVGLVRPFDGTELPFGKKLDRLLEAMQTDAVNVLISGTAGNPERKTVPYAEVADKVGRMFGAMVK